MKLKIVTISLGLMLLLFGVQNHYIKVALIDEKISHNETLMDALILGEQSLKLANTIAPSTETQLASRKVQQDKLEVAERKKELLQEKKELEKVLTLGF